MSDTSNQTEKLRLAKLALDYSERAAALAPKDSDAQLAVAITLGKMMQMESSGERVRNSKRVKEFADRAIRLNSRNDLAWHVLGRWHQGYAELSSVRRKLGELMYGPLPSSTYADAAHAFERAVDVNPHRPMHRIELGRTYAGMGRSAEARTLINQGLGMPNRDKDDPEVKQRGRETLATLE